MTMRLQSSISLFFVVVAALIRQSSGIPRFVMSAHRKYIMFREYMRQLWAKFRVWRKQHLSKNGLHGDGEDMDFADLPEDSDDEDEISTGLHKQMGQNPEVLKKLLAMRQNMASGIPEPDEAGNEDFLLGKKTKPKLTFKKQRVKWVPLVRPRMPAYRRRWSYAPRRRRYRTRRRHG